MMRTRGQGEEDKEARIMETNGNRSDNHHKSALVPHFAIPSYTCSVEDTVTTNGI